MPREREWKDEVGFKFVLKVQGVQLRVTVPVRPELRTEVFQSVAQVRDGQTLVASRVTGLVQVFVLSAQERSC